MKNELNGNMPGTSYQMPWIGETAMNKFELNSVIKSYIDQLQRALHEPILKRELGEFPADERKAFFLLLPLINEDKVTDRLHDVTLSVGAIHAALAIHDGIDREDTASAVQQMTVLAGDHFSGIHYRILAENNEFSFIRELSQTIARINEQKTTLQNAQLVTGERLLEWLKVIESACVTSFYSVYGFSSGYRELAETVLTYVRLLDMASSKQHQAFSIDESARQQAIDLLKPKLEWELQQMNFLQPVLQQKVYDYLDLAAPQS